MKLFVHDARAAVLWLRKSHVKTALICTHFPLRLLKALAKRHLTLKKDVLATRCISIPRREQSHTRRLSHATRESARLAISALRPVNLPQALLELIDLLGLLVAVDGQTALIEADIAVSARAIAMILNGARVDHGSGRVIPSSLHKTCDRWRLGRRKSLEKATIVCLDKCVTPRAVCEVIHAERTRVDLRVADLVCVVAREYALLWHTIDSRIL